MRRTVVALVITALSCGALLEVSFFALNAWKLRLYEEAHAQSLARAQGEDPAQSAVRVENPYESHGESMSTYLTIFILCTAAATFWAVFVVLPILMLSRHVVSGAITSSIVAAIVVCVVSGFAYCLLGASESYMNPLITFSVGGAVGLLSLGLLHKMLPPNKSLERSRDA
jgi:hypothetical protein